MSSSSTSDNSPIAGSIASPKSPEPGDSSPESFDGTVAVVESAGPSIPPAVLSDVRTGLHSTFDRIVFEFKGAVVPGYRIEYIDKTPLLCGSGNLAEVAGQRWLEIQLTPAQSHDNRGDPATTGPGQNPKLPVLVGFQQTCDFEGHVTWVLGVSSPNRYRVLSLSSPPRLVVDVKH